MAEARYLNQEDVFWFDRLELTLDNIRLALENALVLSPLAGARIVIALYYFWLVRGYNSETLGWIEKYLRVLGDTLEERQANADLLPRGNEDGEMRVIENRLRKGASVKIRTHKFIERGRTLSARQEFRKSIFFV